jgi:lipoyl-dependent peroxiredoxin
MATERGVRAAAGELDVEGAVPGIDGDTFRQAAERARDGCPVSLAVKGNVEVSMRATLK